MRRNDIPLLHAPERWDWAEIEVKFSVDLPSDEIVQSVHVIGYVGDRVVLCSDERPDVWFLAGGTREPDESLDDCLARELREEAGVRLARGFADVVVDGEPTSPEASRSWRPGSSTFPRRGGCWPSTSGVGSYSIWPSSSVPQLAETFPRERMRPVILRLSVRYQ